jgi:hypothetical protein
MAGEAGAAAAAYRDFLAATRDAPQFSEQRRVAEQLLARLATRTAERTASEGR